MNKIILGTLLVFFLVVNAQPAIAACKTYFTGGGNITEGHGKDSLKITFATNVLYDYGGLPAGVIHFNFVNTSSGFLDGGMFFSKEINEQSRTSTSLKLLFFSCFSIFEVNFFESFTKS